MSARMLAFDVALLSVQLLQQDNDSELLCCVKCIGADCTLEGV